MLLSLPVFWIAAGWMLFESALRVPRRTGPQLPESSIVAADGAVLRGTFIRTGGNGDCVIVLHGIADSHRSALGFSRMFVDAGYSVLAPDSRAHGASGGDLVTFGYLERDDVLRWTEWLRTHGCRRIYGLGESLGGSILIQAAARQPVFTAIVAECAYRDLPSVAEYRMVRALGGPEFFARPFIRSLLASAVLYGRVRYGFDLTDTSSERAVNVPLLLIHGDADHATPPEHSRAIAAAARTAELWIVPGAGHTTASRTEPAEFRRRVLDWYATADSRTATRVRLPQ